MVRHTKVDYSTLSFYSAARQKLKEEPTAWTIKQDLLPTRYINCLERPTKWCLAPCSLVRAVFGKKLAVPGFNRNRLTYQAIISKLPAGAAAAYDT